MLGLIAEFGDEGVPFPVRNRVYVDGYVHVYGYV